MILSFHRSPILYNELDRYQSAGIVVPFTTAELERVRFGLPFAFVAQYVDLVEFAVILNHTREARANIALNHIYKDLNLQIRLHSERYDSIPRRIGDLVGLDKEIALVKIKYGDRVGLFQSTRDLKLTEAELALVIGEFRVDGHLALLRNLRGMLGTNLAFATDADERRVESLAETLGLCVFGNLR